MENQPTVGSPRNNRIGRPHRFFERDVPTGLRIDIQLELREHRTLNLQASLLNLKAMPVDGAFDHRIPLEDDIPVQFGYRFRQDRAPDKVVLQQNVRFIKTYLFQFLHDYRLFMVAILNRRVMHSLTRVSCGFVEA